MTQPNLFAKETNMATAVEQEVLPPETGTNIIAVVERDPGIVLLDAKKFDVFYDEWKAKADAITPDVSTEKGRAVLRKFAADLRKDKAGIDKARLRLTKEWRDMTAQCNAAGKEIETRLETLAVETRKPLTEWEAAEEERITVCRERITDFKHDMIIREDDTAESVRKRGEFTWNVELDPEQFGDMLAEAQAAKDEAIATLKRALDRLVKEEADRAELERLRAEKEQRDREEDARKAAEYAERQRHEEARQAEERRIAAEKAEAEKVERIRQEAAEAAQREADRKAQEERDRVQREHEEALAKERAERERVEREAQAERDRIAQQKEAEAAEAKRLADEQAEREADKALQRRLKTEAKEAMMACGASEDVAQKIVLAIRAKEIPHVVWEA